jgi:hypothetical protein
MWFKVISDGSVRWFYRDVLSDGEDAWCKAPTVDTRPERSGNLRRFDSHRGQAYFSSLPGADIYTQSNITSTNKDVQVIVTYTQT